MKQDQITTGITLKQILIDLKLCTSNGEAKRLINQNAVKINKEIIRDKDYILNQKLFIKKTHQKDLYIVIYVGKKKYGIVELIT